MTSAEREMLVARDISKTSTKLSEKSHANWVGRSKRFGCKRNELCVLASDCYFNSFLSPRSLQHYQRMRKWRTIKTQPGCRWRSHSKACVPRDLPICPHETAAAWNDAATKRSPHELIQGAHWRGILPPLRLQARPYVPSGLPCRRKGTDVVQKVWL